MVDIHCTKKLSSRSSGDGDCLCSKTLIQGDLGIEEYQRRTGRFRYGVVREVEQVRVICLEGSLHILGGVEKGGEGGLRKEWESCMRIGDIEEEGGIKVEIGRFDVVRKKEEEEEEEEEEEGGASVIAFVVVVVSVLVLFGLRYWIRRPRAFEEALPLLDGNRR